ncbi:Hypothetical predicted protein [Mytilus galloprovincialis]|uniref:Uncharacterized protein n=1 Tax=Mytilus galloprovincialis TaxID=29158 RepID=A0A8B6CCU1_MYTGA|nr:Hypothetical predicted protein [Mytilus galloprovincialis]
MGRGEVNDKVNNYSNYSQMIEWDGEKCCLMTKDKQLQSDDRMGRGEVLFNDKGYTITTNSASQSRTQVAAATSNVKANILEDVMSFPVRSKFSPDGKSQKYTVWATVDNIVCQIPTFKGKSPAAKQRRPDKIYKTAL